MEITVDSADDLQSAWPDVDYKGKPFFDAFYKALEEVDPLEFSDDFQESQEVYVGYLPETDEFFVGWDAWHHGNDEDEDDPPYMGAIVCAFKFDGKKLISGRRVLSSPIGFYSHRGLSPYKTIHIQYPSLKALRLD